MTLAFEQLVAEHGARIRQIARRYADPASVDDLVQEILVRLWRSLPGFRGEAKVETWVYRVALNAAMTGVRQVIRQRETEQSAAALNVESHALPANAPTEQVLDAFVQQLGEVDASILMMYLDDLSAEDMSGVLGISPNAINVRITRLRKKFIQGFVD